MKKILYTAAEIDKIVSRLAGEIDQYYMSAEHSPKPEPVVAVCVLRGGVLFFADLIRKLSTPVEAEFIRTASYGNEQISSGTVRILSEPALSVQGRRILIVEDLIDTGQTLRFVRDYFCKKGAKEVEIAVLLDKPARREVEVPCRFIGEKAENYFLCGYGLDGGTGMNQQPAIYYFTDE